MYRFQKLICALALGAGVGLLASGCGQGPVDDSAGAVSFSPLETGTVTPEVVSDRQQVPAKQKKQVQDIIDGFKKNALKFFQSGDPQGRLSQIETVFIASGHYLDLVGIYQNVVEKQGISSDAVPHLARAYLRLGQEPEARALLDKMILHRANEPQTWFLNGAYWLPKAQNSEDAAARVVASWQKALEIDPNFNVAGQGNTPPLRQQLAALRQRTPKEAIKKAVDEIAQKPVDLAKKPIKAAPRSDLRASDLRASAPSPAPPGAKPRAQSAPSPAPQAPSPAQSAPSPAPQAETAEVIIARGDIALSQGDADKAEQYYKKALQQKPNSASARFGLIRAAWTDDARRNQAGRDLRKLAKRDDLSARQLYDVGLFAFSKLGDNKLAIDLWKRAKQSDPALARQANIDELIKQASR